MWEWFQVRSCAFHKPDSHSGSAVLSLACTVNTPDLLKIAFTGLSSSLGLEVTVVSGSRAGLLDWLLWEHIPGIPIWSQVAAQTLRVCWTLNGNRSHDINTGVSRPWTKTRTALGSSPGSDITMTLGGRRTTRVNPLLTVLACPDLPLSWAHELFCPSLPAFSPPYPHSP